jgi:hypothetical protein
MSYGRSSESRPTTVSAVPGMPWPPMKLIFRSVAAFAPMVMRTTQVA